MVKKDPRGYERTVGKDPRRDGKDEDDMSPRSY
jgi:hypothetical protein